MRSWVELYEAHRSTRSLRKGWDGEVRKRLMKLADAGHCTPNVRGLFTYIKRKPDQLENWSIQGAPLELKNLDGLTRAGLDVLALVCREHLHQFTVAIDATRSDGTPWTIAAHLSLDRDRARSLDGDRQGLGACSHAALHCHVGPGLDVEPKVRVPLPALSPVDILDWVLSQVVPTAAFEPAPWSEVERALKTDR